MPTAAPFCCNAILARPCPRRSAAETTDRTSGSRVRRSSISRGARYFLIAYINGTTPSYQLHALNLATLADAIPPVTVAATQTLTDGTKFPFNATYQRQRPGLLEMNNVIYAGFGSFCDFRRTIREGGCSVGGRRRLPLSFMQS